MTGPGRLVEGLLVHGAGLVVALLILGILIALTACDGEQSAPPTRTSASLEPTPAAVPTQTQAQSPIETLEPAPTPITAVGSTQPATPERLPTATPTPTRIPTAMPIPTVTADSAISSATEAQAQVVSAVTVTPAAATLVAGDTLRLSPQAKDANSHAIAGAVFAWASSDTLVARVDDTGLVTAVAAGEAAITAATGGVNGRVDLTVTPASRWTLSGSVSHGWSYPRSDGSGDGATEPPSPEASRAAPGAPVSTTPTGDVIGAVVEIVDGPDAGRQAYTGDNGRYMLEALQQAQFTIRVTAEGFTSVGGVVDLTSDMVLDFAIAHEPPTPQPSSPFPDTDPAWLRVLSSDYPYSHQVANVRVFSDISPTFSREHAEHLKLVWDFFNALYVRNRGAHVDIYYTSDPEVFQQVVPHCPTIFIPGARNLTSCYLDYPRWFIIPYQIPDFGTLLHEIGHDFLFATRPEIYGHRWFVEGTAMYFEGGEFINGSLRVSKPLYYCTYLRQRFDEQASLIPLGQLLRLETDAFLADNERTYSQSCMLFIYLEQREPGVLYALIEQINSGHVLSNDQLITALLDLTGQSISELEEAYQSYAR